MDNLKKLRLDVLVKNFRNVPNVKDGYNDLSKLIHQGKDKELKRLLRKHTEPIVTDDEVDRRDNIDFLLGFYSLVQIGLIANYLPLHLNPELNLEIRSILENKRVKEFYTNHYKLYLPKLLIEHLKNIDQGIKQTYLRNVDEDKTAILFEKFLLLHRTIIYDKDIHQFLWFLDDGFTFDKKMNDYADIDDLMKVLSDPANRNKLLIYESLKASPLEKSIYGFGKYINYLNTYSSFLKECSKIELFHSACWHIESYWFDHLDEKMGDKLIEAITNVQRLVNLDYYKTNDEYIDSKVTGEWKRESSRIIKEALKAINYLFNAKHGIPIKELVN